MSDIQQNYGQPIINQLQNILFRKSRARRYDIQLSTFSSNRWYDLPNEINSPGRWLKIGSWRTWWTGGAALVAVFLPHSFEAQETSERSYLFEHKDPTLEYFLEEQSIPPATTAPSKYNGKNPLTVTFQRFLWAISLWIADNRLIITLKSGLSAGFSLQHCSINLHWCQEKGQTSQDEI